MFSLQDCPEFEPGPFSGRAPSTARVLDLKPAHDRLVLSGQRERLLFRSRRLNEAVVVKHRIRPHEVRIAGSARTIATKIIAPDSCGALRTLFIGERHWLDALNNDCGLQIVDGDDDHRVLTALDRAPSFDPVILGYVLARRGVGVDPAYLPVSDTTRAEIDAFTLSELTPVARTFLGPRAGVDAVRGYAARLASSQDAREFPEFRQALSLSFAEFLDLMCAWRSGIYLKWRARSLAVDVTQALQELEHAVELRAAAPGASPAPAERVERLRRRLRDRLVASAETLLASDLSLRDAVAHCRIEAMVKVAQQRLDLFFDLGADLAGLEHAASYVNWRFRTDRPRALQEGPLEDMLCEFEEALADISTLGVRILKI